MQRSFTNDGGFHIQYFVSGCISLGFGIRLTTNIHTFRVIRWELEIVRNFCYFSDIMQLVQVLCPYRFRWYQHRKLAKIEYTNLCDVSCKNNWLCNLKLFASESALICTFDNDKRRSRLMELILYWIPLLLKPCTAYFLNNSIVPKIKH